MHVNMGSKGLVVFFALLAASPILANSSPETEQALSSPLIPAAVPKFRFAKNYPAAKEPGLHIGRCALGSPHECFDRIQKGLAPDDRPYVRLGGEGKFPAVHVDKKHASTSENFRTLERIA